MSNPLYEAIFHVASALEVPVVAAAVLALAAVIVELGRFGVELRARRGRRPRARHVAALEQAVGDGGPGLAALACSADMQRALTGIAGDTTDVAVAKRLADFDLACERRLARTRLLVRVGPALGLMGTLIPLTPALDGLAGGNVRALSDNLRVAFSVTVLGLLVGAVAFALSLARESMYGQDYSDVEYVAALLDRAGDDAS